MFKGDMMLITEVRRCDGTVSYVITYNTNTREKRLWQRNILFFTSNVLMSFMTNATLPR